MKTRKDIVENWLPRYTGTAIDDFGPDFDEEGQPIEEGGEEPPPRERREPEGEVRAGEEEEPEAEGEQEAEEEREAEEVTA